MENRVLTKRSIGEYGHRYGRGEDISTSVKPSAIAHVIQTGKKPAVYRRFTVRYNVRSTAGIPPVFYENGTSFCAV